MSDVSDSVFMRSIRNQPVPYTPVWLMRQAGRYLPEYRKVREQAGDFLTLCKTPALATEVALQPLRRFDLDAAIVFSDILTIPDAMGLGLSFAEGEGPCFARPLRDVSAIEAILDTRPNESLDYVMEAVSQIRAEMPKGLPLIGFAGSPWTLACYMIEGQSSREFKHALRVMYDTPGIMHQLLKKLSETIVTYLDEQVQAGANALMLFDTWGGLLTTRCYCDFSRDYLHDITRQLHVLHPSVPVIAFTKGGGQWLTQQVDIGCEVLGLDWTCDLTAARAQVGSRVALQGNLDPSVLIASPSAIQREVSAVLAAYGHGSGLIFNLGHGITPDVPPDHVALLVDTVHALSPMYHQSQS